MNWIGKTIEQFRIEEQIGAGTNGRLFASRHLSEQTFAAVRILDDLPGQDGDARRREYEDRFALIAQTQAALSHPHIIRTHRYGRQAGSTLYLITDLMDGDSLESLVAAGQTLPLALCVDIALQAADALQYAHDRQVVHGGVKPNNVLRRQREAAREAAEGIQVRLSDFQMVRLENGSYGKGALAYMSPEQCQGLEIDRRSDLYSLGIVLYQLVTNLLPFQPTDREEASAKHMHQAPPPPKRNRPDLSPSLEAIILRCLMKRPEERFDSAGELADALKAERLTLPDYPWPLKPRQKEAWTPPEIPPLNGDSAVPRIQVLNREGVRQQIVSLEHPVVRIGRINECDIVLDSRTVGRQHLELKRVGDQIMLVDLGSGNGTRLLGKRLRPNEPQPWRADQPVQVGPFWLCLSMPAIVEKKVERKVEAPAPPRFSVALDKETLELTPNVPQMLSISVSNQGQTVDHLTLTVEGLPTNRWIEWPSKGANEVVQLNPGQSERVLLKINVPRKAENRARVYTVRIRAASRQRSSEVVLAPAHWKVLSFAAGKIALEPRKAAGLESARYELILHNEGNAPADYSLTISDDEKALTCRMDREIVNVPDIKPVGAPFTVQAKKRWFGNPQSRRFTVTARARATGVEETVSGEFEHRAVFPPWVLQLLLLLLALLIALTIYLVSRHNADVAARADQANQKAQDARKAQEASHRKAAQGALGKAQEAAAAAAGAAAAASTAASQKQAAAKDLIKTAEGDVRVAQMEIAKFQVAQSLSKEDLINAKFDIETASSDIDSADEMVAKEKKAADKMTKSLQKMKAAEAERDKKADDLTRLGGVPSDDGNAFVPLVSTDDYNDEIKDQEKRLKAVP